MRDNNLYPTRPYQSPLASRFVRAEMTKEECSDLVTMVRMKKMVVEPVQIGKYWMLKFQAGPDRLVSIGSLDQWYELPQSVYNRILEYGRSQSPGTPDVVWLKA